MNCHRVQSLLSAYLDHEVSPEERRLIRQHLFFCKSCSRMFEELTVIKGSLGGLEIPAIEDNPLRKIEKTVLYYNEGHPSELVNNAIFWGKRLLLTAGCLLLFLLTSLLLFPTPNSSNPSNLAADSHSGKSYRDQGQNYQTYPTGNFSLIGFPVSR